MKNKSDFSMRSSAACGKGRLSVTSVGCGTWGTMCFLFKYFGQFPGQKSATGFMTKIEEELTQTLLNLYH